MNYLYGLLDLSFWGYVIAGVVMVQITMMAVTLYLHRDAAHRALDLHPVLRHFFRFWIWCTSGMLTREWVAVHRKHHAYCETKDDPHSPQIYGLRKVLLEGAELYQAERNRPETLEKFGRGTPDDWIERNVYLRYPNAGIITLVVTDLLLFGVPGIILIAVQLAAMPVFAAGIINGLGHHSGYRNFECDDAATNLVPWGILIGGEELHNNHHAFPTSAKFSVQSWEFDIGWMYIRILSALGLARVRKVAPKPVLAPRPGLHADIENLRAVIVNRMHVLRDYTRQVTLPVLRTERTATASGEMLRRARKLLVRQPKLLDERARARLGEILSRNQALETVHRFRERLSELWSGANVSNERLLAQLQQWCAEAEASGIQALEDFAARLRAYRLAPN
ncbi:MAG: fatty acid desaturase [Gammaproteobacteria bacterium]|nr:fatty acid desaturase [Gammaproteobacteria bacterium]MDH4253750.1 fatty acid desaturase [Gammaproteobacteria bacterium]MDH5309679.1 fatty acid desaturase [Gammaproteobacteria bacterium]